MGFAVPPALEIVLDTVKSSRKYPNLKKNACVAWVVGCTTEVTVQYEGIAEELEGKELVKYKRPYFAKFPDGPHGRVGRASRILWCVRSGEVLRLQSADATD